MTSWTIPVLLLAALKVAFGVAAGIYSAFTGSIEANDALGFGLLHMFVFGAVGLVLIFNANRDERAFWLGAAFSLIAVTPSDRLFVTVVGISPWLDGVVHVMSRLHPDAFMPLCFWRFFSEFPRAADDTASQTVSRVGIALSKLSGIVLFLLHAAPLLAVGPLRAPLAPLQPSRALYLYTYVVLLLLTIPTCLYAFWRVRTAAVGERRRARLFVAGIVIGSLPIWINVFVRAVSPAARAWLDEPTQAWIRDYITRLAFLTIPASTAYSVLVNHVLDVKLVIRQALQYGLARYAVMTATAVPFLALLVYFYRNRDATIADLISGTGALILIAATIFGLVMVQVRQNVLAAIDRRFFREHYDARQILVSLIEGSRRATSPRELADMLSTEIDRALHLEKISIFVLDTTLAELRNGETGMPPVASGSPLAMLVSSQEDPLALDWHHEQSAVARLPEEDREWLRRSGFELLVPLISSDGTLVGIAALGEKKGERPFTNEDRELLATIASSAALTLENRIKISSPGDWPSGGIASGGDESVELALECEHCKLVVPPDSKACKTCGGQLFKSSVPYVLSAKFRLEQRIGAGGMGVVYRAVDLALGRRVAIKTLPQLSMEYASRLRREARAMATVTHGNLAMIYGVESWRGTPLLVVELLEGGTLSTRIASGPLPLPAVLELGSMIASVLEILHGAGVLHRDVKPSNVGYSDSDVPKLLDFGLAKILGDSRLASPATRDDRYEDLQDVPLNALTQLTATRCVVGTPIYLSPEAATGDDPDALFDLWALAVVMYEAAAGAHPLRIYDTKGLRERIFEGRVADINTLMPDCPQPVSSFFADVLARDRNRRPQTATEFRARVLEVRETL